MVVIAIIAILAAMLLPALSKAREKARAISCLNNLKSCGLQIGIYRDENDDFFYSPHPEGKVSPISWGAMLITKQYASDYKSMRCPSVTGKGSTEALDIYGAPVNINTNEFALRGFDLRSSKIFRLNNATSGAIQSPSQMLMLSDSREYGQQNMHCAIRAASITASWGRIYLAHADRGNVLFIDGHAQAVNHKEFFNGTTVLIFTDYGAHNNIARPIFRVMDGTGTEVNE